MEIKDKRVIDLVNKVDKLSLKYHRLSLLMNELKTSLEVQGKQGKTYKELLEQIKGLDLSKVQDLTKTNWSDLKK